MTAKKKEIYARFGVQLLTHHRSFDAGVDAMGLYAFAVMWTRAEQKDGFIPRSVLLSAWGATPAANKKRADRLIACGFLVEVDGGYEVRLYAEHNDTAEEIADAKKATKERVSTHRKNGGGNASVTRYTPVTAPPCNAFVPSSSSISESSTQRPEQNEIASAPPLAVPVAAGEPEESGVPASEWAMHDRLFIAAYERAARAAIGNPMWTMRRTSDLQKVLAACCRGSARADIEGWIEVKVRELVAFIATVPDADRRFWPEPDAGAMLRWFNRKAPRSEVAAPAAKRQPTPPYLTEYVDPYETVTPAARSAGGSR